MKDFTNQHDRKEVNQLIKSLTGKDYKTFSQEVISKRLGELIQGSTKTRKVFDKQVINEAIYDLILKNIQKSTEKGLESTDKDNING